MEENKELALVEKKWFVDLVEQTQLMVLEIKNLSWNIVTYYHNVGKLIVENKDKCKDEGILIEDFLSALSEQVGRSKSTLYIASRFYEKYPDLKTSPFAEETQWYQIAKKIESDNKKASGKDKSNDSDEEEVAEGEVRENYLEKTVTITVFELLDLLYADDDEKQLKKNFIEDLITEKFGKDKLTAILDDFYKKKSEEKK